MQKDSPFCILYAFARCVPGIVNSPIVLLSMNRLLSCIQVLLVAQLVMIAETRPQSVFFKMEYCLQVSNITLGFMGYTLYLNNYPEHD